MINQPAGPFGPQLSSARETPRPAKLAEGRPSGWLPRSSRAVDVPAALQPTYVVCVVRRGRVNDVGAQQPRASTPRASHTPVGATPHHGTSLIPVLRRGSGRSAWSLGFKPILSKRAACRSPADGGVHASAGVAVEKDDDRACHLDQISGPETTPLRWHCTRDRLSVALEGCESRRARDRGV